MLAQHAEAVAQRGDTRSGGRVVERERAIQMFRQHRDVARRGGHDEQESAGTHQQQQARARPTVRARLGRNEPTRHQADSQSEGGAARRRRQQSRPERHLRGIPHEATGTPRLAAANVCAEGVTFADGVDDEQYRSQVQREHVRRSEGPDGPLKREISGQRERQPPILSVAVRQQERGTQVRALEDGPDGDEEGNGEKELAELPDALFTELQEPGGEEQGKKCLGVVPYAIQGCERRR